MEQKLKKKDYKKKKGRNFNEIRNIIFTPELKASRWIVISQINEHVCIHVLAAG